MFQEPQPNKQTYRLPYQQCKTHGQKLNYICLDSKCHQKSLICSLCRDEQQHNNHLIRPLKFYLQELQEKYSNSQSESTLNSLLDELEVSQFTFYQKLKKSVEQIAQKFQKLEEQVTQEIDKIRNQIFEEIAKRNRFNEFYQSLRRGNIDHSNFIIQNYLPQTSVGKVSNLDKLQKLTEEVCCQIQQTGKSIIIRQQIQSPVKLKNLPKVLNNSFDLETALKRPGNVKWQGNVLIPNLNLGYADKQLCIIDHPVYNLQGKLALKLIQLKKNAKIIISVMPKAVYEAMEQNWLPNKLNDKCFVLGHDGFNRGWTKAQITRFGQGSSLELCQKGEELKITQKNKSNTAKLPTDIDLFVVIALTGECQLKVNHVK